MSKSIEQVDSNFKVTQLGAHTDVMFHDVLAAPFRVYGLMRDEVEGCFVRLPIATANATNEGVAELVYHLAGGRVRFATDSPYVAINASMHHIGKMPHFALSGSAGFDLYYEEDDAPRYGGTFMPPFTIETGYTSLIELPQPRTMREVTIHFPLYSGVKSLQIGLAAGSTVQAPRPYTTEKPVVYYGSSITQGGCASRPGNAYQNIMSRRLDVDHINLGFSGSARGEDVMADYIAGLDMSVFVLDYDHNAPSAAHLAATHERMFLRVREQHPGLPVIMVSRPKVHLNEEERERLAIIRTTYERALARGDKAVAFIDGSQLLTRFGGEDGTVDNAHPTDLGFMCMAEGIGEELKKWL